MRADKKSTREALGEDYKMEERRKNRAARHKYYVDNWRAIEEYLGDIKCERCGYTSECYAPFDFHHIDPKMKSFGIHTRIDSSPFKNWKDEVDKCILLCSNCHRKEHSTRCKKD